MKISEIETSDICRQIRVEETYLTEDDKMYLPILLRSAVEYVKSFTGLDNDELDEHEDLTDAVLVLISDMYDNRQMTVDSSNVNMTAQTILGFHCVNLL